MTWRPADAARVHQRGGGGREGGGGGPGAAAAPRTVAVHIRARVGDEHFAAFKEEQALLREVGLERRQVHHHGVRLHGAEVWIQRAGELQVGRGAPRDVHAHAVFLAIRDGVVDGGGMGEEIQLAMRVQVREAHRLQCGHEAAAREGQRRPAVNLIEMRDFAVHPKRQLTRAGALRRLRGRHRHHGPRQEHLDAPTIFADGAGAFPRAIPLLGEGALRQRLAVHHGAAEGHGEPIAVEAGAGGVQRQAEAVAVQVLVAGRQARDEGVCRLFHHRRHVEPFGGVEEPVLGAVAGRGEGVWVDHAHGVARSAERPIRFRHVAVDDDCHRFRIGDVEGRPGSAIGRRGGVGAEGRQAGEERRGAQGLRAAPRPCNVAGE